MNLGFLNGGGGGWWNEDASTFGNIANLGAGVFQSVLGYKLMSNQINHSMTPTISYNQQGQPVGIPVGVNNALSNAFSSGWSGWLLWIVIAIVVILLLKK